MISDGTLSIFATDEAPSTKKSAPFIRKINPSTSKPTAIIISIVYLLRLIYFNTKSAQMSFAFRPVMFVETIKMICGIIKRHLL
jgi:hypothetical protein